MAEELKACPFCGGDAELRLYDAQYFVQCVQCFNSTSADHDLESSAIAAWNTRAQLPSQKGEAVATHLGWDFLDDGSRVATYFIRAAGEVAPKLYTHPADQVEDDLTMVKVSRELLQDLRDLAFDQVEHHRAAMGAYKQTRQSAMDSVLAQADALLRS